MNVVVCYVLYDWDISNAYGMNRRSANRCLMNHFLARFMCAVFAFSGLRGRVCQSWPMRMASTARSAVRPRRGLWPLCWRSSMTSEWSTPCPPPPCPPHPLPMWCRLPSCSRIRGLQFHWRGRSLSNTELALSRNTQKAARPPTLPTLQRQSNAVYCWAHCCSGFG